MQTLVDFVLLVTSLWFYGTVVLNFPFSLKNNKRVKFNIFEIAVGPREWDLYFLTRASPTRRLPDGRRTNTMLDLATPRMTSAIVVIYTLLGELIMGYDQWRETSHKSVGKAVLE